ncbi:methyl-accepting chemotaxis protein [Aidingimonas lacisalsi]|uniref:methyl-accepting chemotaxis protein n=1 Tax=Aidingimonas lacisalsi TaxID=2604086 RepID=UPI0011D200F4|nr:methyl-accepting chemotaxis protein [Aidingimonas lacisalsi]
MRLLDRMTVRLSSFLVLAVFTTLILGIGAFGLFANQNGRDAFEQLRQIQVAQSRALNQAYIASLRAQVTMDRAAQLIRTPSFDRPGPVIEQADAHMQQARDAFETFLSIPPLAAQAEAIDVLSSRFQSLVDTGLNLQLLMLQEGDVSGYASGQSRVSNMSEAFMESADAFSSQTAKQGDAWAARFDTLTDWLNVALGGALVLALVTVLVVVWGIQTKILHPLRRIVNHFRRIADGDLSTPVDNPGHNEIARLFQEVEVMRRSLADIVRQLRNSSTCVGQGMQAMSTSNQQLAERTHQQAASLQQTAANFDDLTTTVSDNAGHVHQADSLSSEATGKAHHGSQGVTAFADTMEEIHQRAARIGEIVGAIDAIAFQTTLLALNASVEAARAGQSGRGFAVVAGEVRTLAARSASAAREIRELSESAQESVTRGHALSDQARQDMQAIVEAIQGVSGLVNEVARASAEQQQGLEQVNQAMHQIKTVTQNNNAMVEQVSHTADDLDKEAEAMQDFARRFILPTDVEPTA